MGKFNVDSMVENLDELFSDTYVSVEREGDMVVVNCAELGTLKCMTHIEDAFDGSGGLVSGLVDKVVGG
jgi:hypothetical protein